MSQWISAVMLIVAIVFITIEFRRHARWKKDEERFRKEVESKIEHIVKEVKNVI